MRLGCNVDERKIPTIRLRERQLFWTNEKRCDDNERYVFVYRQTFNRTVCRTLKPPGYAVEETIFRLSVYLAVVRPTRVYPPSTIQPSPGIAAKT